MLIWKTKIVYSLTGVRIKNKCTIEVFQWNYSSNFFYWSISGGLIENIIRQKLVERNMSAASPASGKISSSYSLSAVRTAETIHSLRQSSGTVSRTYTGAWRNWSRFVSLSLLRTSVIVSTNSRRRFWSVTNSAAFWSYQVSRWDKACPPKGPP
jgi:hypothetical protein